MPYVPQVSALAVALLLATEAAAYTPQGSDRTNKLQTSVVEADGSVRVNRGMQWELQGPAPVEEAATGEAAAGEASAEPCADNDAYCKGLSVDQCTDFVAGQNVTDNCPKLCGKCPEVEVTERGAEALGDHLGEKLEENVGEATGVEEHEVHNHVALLFFFMCLATGAFVMYFLNRVMPWFPYTVALLMIGIITGLIFNPKDKIEAEKGAFAQTIWMWDHISPHLLLFAFLPGLLFADCISMGWHIFCKSLIQCVILAIPGVVMATFMVAGFAMTVFPYGWNFAFAMTFGSTLAATDPVAVVAILKSLGAPDALTMLVSGESLLNDGSAIVVFNVFNAMALGTQEKLEEVGVPKGQDHVDATVIITYFFRMALGGPALGTAFAIVACSALRLTGRRTSHDDSTIQIFIAFTTAYMSFFVAEYWCHVSGVLTCVTAGVLISAFASPRFANPEVMEAFWHVIENVGNTVIFLLAGLIIGYSIHDGFLRNELGGNDVLMLLLLFATVNAARYVMVFFFYPVISRTGYGLDLPSAVVLGFGGIHGAVGLALAMVIFEEYEGNIQGARVMFHIGGVTVLSLLVNGLLSAPLLNKCGLTAVDPAKLALKEDVMKQIRTHSKLLFEELCGGTTGNPSEKSEVIRLCHILEEVDEKHFPSPHHQVERKSSFVSDETKQHAFIAARELFIASLRHQYEEQGKSGILARGSPGEFCLKSSLDYASEDSENGLTDVTHVLNQLTRQNWYGWLFSHGITEWSKVCLLSTLIAAHSEARATLEEALGSVALFEETKEHVIQESHSQVALAQAALDEMDQRLVKAVRPRQLACKILAASEEHVEKMVNSGMLREADAHHLLEEIEEDVTAAQAPPK